MANATVQARDDTRLRIVGSLLGAAYQGRRP